MRLPTGVSRNESGNSHALQLSRAASCSLVLPTAGRDWPGKVSNTARSHRSVDANRIHHRQRSRRKNSPCASTTPSGMSATLGLPEIPNSEVVVRTSSDDSFLRPVSRGARALVTCPLPCSHIPYDVDWTLPWPASLVISRPRFVARSPAIPPWDIRREIARSAAVNKHRSVAGPDRIANFSDARGRPRCHPVERSMSARSPGPARVPAVDWSGVVDPPGIVSTGGFA